jgi:hypothetical protein
MDAVGSAPGGDIREIRLALGRDEHGCPMLLRHGSQSLHLIGEAALVGNGEPQQDGRDGSGSAGLGEARCEGRILQDGGDEVKAGGGVGHGSQGHEKGKTAFP